MMKWILIVIGVPILLLALVALIGAFVPRDHRATCLARFRTEAEPLFAAMTEVESFPQWRADVRSVKRIDAIGRKPAYLEESKHGAVAYVVETSDPPRKLVLRIADDSLPYGGSWTFQLTSGAGGTTVLLTEDGFIGPVIFRALARFAFGYHATMEQYLKALGAKFGETVAVERVR